MIPVSHRAFRVWQRHRDVYLRLWRSEVIWPLFEPLIALLAIGFGLGTFVDLGGQRYVEFLAPGLLAVYPMWGAVSEGSWGAYTRMVTRRIYEAIMATPVSVEDIIAGEVLWGATRALVDTVYIFVLVLAFGLLGSPWALVAFPIAFLQGLMFAAMALAFTATVRAVSSLNYFFAVFIIPMFWLSGAFFPLERMPAAVQRAAWFVPTTHTVNIYRALVEGSFAWEHLADLAWLLVATALAFALALFAMRRRLIK